MPLLNFPNRISSHQTIAEVGPKYTFNNFGVIPENTSFGIKVSAAKNLMEGNQIPL